MRGKTMAKVVGRIVMLGLGIALAVRLWTHGPFSPDNAMWMLAWCLVALPTIALSLAWSTDIAGLYSLFGLDISGQPSPELEEGEEVLSTEYEASANVSWHVLGYFQHSLEATLTNRRVVLRLILMPRSRCWRTFRFTDLERVEERPLRRVSFLGRRALKFVEKDGDPSQTLYLELKDRESWLKILEDAGVTVVRDPSQEGEAGRETP